MQRLIVTSATYRQSSNVTPALRETGSGESPAGARAAIPAAGGVDSRQALAVSGLLNEEIGGPSVLPYQPKGLWEEMAFGEGFSAQMYVQSHGQDLYRRGMYTFWKRTFRRRRWRLSTRRIARMHGPPRRTNTPLQALVLMNDPTYVEAARALAQRVLLEGGKDDRSRVEYAFRLATARGRREGDGVLRELHSAAGVRSEATPTAGELIGVGESSRDAGSMRRSWRRGPRWPA